jgi:hypothetical protein
MVSCGSNHKTVAARCSSVVEMGLGIVQRAPQKFAQINPRALSALVLFASAIFLGTLAVARVPRSETKPEAAGHRKTATIPPSLAAGNSGPGWAIVKSPNTTEQHFAAMSCASASDCWAVGHYTSQLGFEQTLTEHWDGSAWKIVTSPNSSSTEYNYLEGVICNSTSDCWATGWVRENDGTESTATYLTLVEHWDGVSWSIVSSPNPGTKRNKLWGVTCNSTSDCWTVGIYRNTTGSTHTLIEHWDGTAWSVVTSPNTSVSQQNDLYSVTCASSSDCWAVGNYFTSGISQTLTEHWDGASWSIVISPNTATTQNNFLNGVTCNSAIDCWTVGYYDSGAFDATGNPISQTLIERWNGAAWLVTPSPNSSTAETNYLLGVDCASASLCWAVGYNFGANPDQTAVIERWNGTVWTMVAAPSSNPVQANQLNAVVCPTNSQCWAVGSSDAQLALTEKWDGTSWSIVSSPSAAGGGSDNRLNDVACSSASDCWAVGRDSLGESYFQHWDGASWTRFYAPITIPFTFKSLSGVTCISAADCWAVGDANDANDVDQGLIEHWDGSSWTVVTSPIVGSGSALADVACTSTANCWAVGYQTTPTQTLIEHWNGVAWTVVPSPNVNTADFNQLRGVACASAADCWAVGYTGSNSTSVYQPLMEHWDGNSWTIVSSPSVPQQDFINGVACASSSDCWAVGFYNDGQNSGGSLIEHWNGSAWSIVASPNSSTGGTDLEDVTCVSNSNCWAVGNAGTTFTAHWNGSAWTSVPSPSSTLGDPNQLHSVTCPTAETCWAVGEYKVPASSTFGQTLIEEYSLTIPPLIRVGSRMTHGGAVTFDVDLPIIGKRGVECRSGGANGNYSVVFSFVNDVTNCGSTSASGATIVPGPNTNQCTENLTGVPNAQYVSVELDNVVDSQNNTGNVAVQMGVLIGDTNADGFVDSADIGQTKSKSGTALSLSTLREDINHDSFIDSADIAFVKSKSGTALPSLP